MVRKGEQQGVPNDEPRGPPRDLHPTSDIRFVIVEVTKLSTLVERLIKDVGAQEEKLDALRHQATYIKGGLAVAVIALGLFGWFISQMVDGKLQAVLTALAAIK
jgi:uncharacterized membrane protein YjjP (DUF1212 family)